MAIFTTPTFNEYMFASEFSQLQITGVSTQEMSLVITSGGNTVFSNTYIPDDDGTVTIYDLDKVLSANIVGFETVFKFLLNGAQIGATDVHVVKCTAAVAEPAQSFLSKHFLTPCLAERNTAMGRYELLSVICTEDSAQISVECTYYKSDGTVHTESSILAGDINIWDNLDVSPDLFRKKGEQLVYYVVKCGKRSQAYRVLDYAPKADPAIIFRNCFNVWDTLFFTGAKEVSPTYTRSQANINGVASNYNINEVISYKANTGPLRPGMEALVRDLANSKQIFILNPDRSIGDELTITDSDLKYTNEPQEIIDLSINYRRAKRSNSIVEVPYRPHVFDKSFDDTYE